MAVKRDAFSTRLGFILAASGSAVGLGNIWRFPYITQDNGGGAFVLIYLAFVAIVGFSVMLLELSIGRRTQSNPVGALGSLGGGPWRALGYLFVATGVVILSYYGVVAGWTVGYLVKSIAGHLDPKAFNAFTADPFQQILYLALFLAATAVVVSGGVRGGIERITSALMPVLILLMLALIIRGFFLDGAMEGLKFYLIPDFDKVTKETFVFAVGQAFFSLSLGMGAMITYGSYLQKKENLVTSAASVVVFDTAIALMAGFLIFPVLGGAVEKGGPTLVFVTLIEIFRTLPGGQIVAVIFFTLLAIAALTSTVSLLEVATAHLVDDRGWKRKKAVCTVTAVTFLLGIPSALSFGGVTWLSDLLGKGFLGLMDFLFGNIALSFGALMLCLFAAYKLKFKPLHEEIECNGMRFAASWLGITWRWCVRIVAPALVALVLFYVIFTGQGLA